MPNYMFAQKDGPFVDLATQYLDALLARDRSMASQLVLEAVEGGIEVRDIYLHVFQRCQREIGHLWQTNQVSVAQEHYCTAATQLIMSQLYPHIFSTEKTGKALVATCVSGELHEVGVRMVADFFEMEGWDTYYVGANMPPESVASAVVDNRADVLGISATMHPHMAEVQTLIDAVRASDAGRQLKIMVGGYSFNVAPGLHKKVGADAYAEDAGQAVAVANKLLGDAS